MFSVGGVSCAITVHITTYGVVNCNEELVFKELGAVRVLNHN